MPRRLRNRVKSEMPMGPFADIAFLLIIFFILVTSLTENYGFTSEIPAGEKSESKQKKDTVVSIRGDQIFLNDKAVDMTTLRKRLDALELDKKKDEQAKTIVLKALKDVKYKHYYGAMAAITNAGGIVAIVKEESK